jgi:AcrR family transcriptional regulator
MARARPSSRERWLDEALAVLATHGHEGLRAEPLSRRLHVSRGSFYWHFADVASFHHAVLERWEATAIDRPLAIAARRRRRSEAGRDDSLGRLIDIAFTAPPDLERAVHAWAAVNAEATKAVAAVNRRRLSLLAAMFGQGGLSRQEAEASAAVLYWAYLGRVLYPDLPVSKARLAQVKARLGLEGGARAAKPNPD